MMSSYDNITTDENGNIKNGLRADIMRCCMENKNLLEEQGSLYVGTDERYSISGGAVEIPLTAALNPGNFGEVLMVDGQELSYNKLSEANFICDNNNVVIGDVGASNYPVLEACNIYKEDLFLSRTNTFPSTHFTINFPYDRHTFLGHLSIIAANGFCIDFGMLYADGFVNNTKKIYLYPINYGDFFVVPDASSSGRNHLLFLLVSIIGTGSNLTLDCEIRGGSSAISLFPSSSTGHYSIWILKTIYKEEVI